MQEMGGIRRRILKQILLWVNISSHFFIYKQWQYLENILTLISLARMTFYNFEGMGMLTISKWHYFFISPFSAKDCPDLNTPKKGAKACFFRMCLPFCNKRSDFSQALRSNMWACGTSQEWLPTVMPDCTSEYKKNNRFYIFNSKSWMKLS